MLIARFHRAVATTLADVDLAAARDARARDTVIEFVDGQLRALPVHLAIGVSAAAALLVMLTVVTRGRPFGALPPAARADAVRRWSTSSLPPARLYVRLLRSLVVYAAHEVEVAA